ncbi:MAG: LysR family transcriptional regulator [Tateyamaria sp.]|uniref:helix-turn-helix domain-containing protein n=1 Tax=Tateyamaria sp. TaxID=1929288 RepID=UPI00327A8C2A
MPDRNPNRTQKNQQFRLLLFELECDALDERSQLLGNALYQTKITGDVTVAMLRAFVCMGRTLNLSQTCLELDTTRQTVRRHIRDLELIKGEPLFDLVDRQYRLTPFGLSSLEEAKFLLLKLETWAGLSNLKRDSSSGLEKLQYTDSKGRVYRSEQHSISQIAMNGLPIIKKTFVAWGNAEAQFESEAMEKIWPYAVLFRKGPSGWVFVRVGRESAYARWFGWAWSKSAIGKLISDDNIGDEYNEFSLGAYARIYDEGGVRLDHIYAHLEKDGGEPKPVTFQRLLLGGMFPDGTPGLIVLAALTEQIEIQSLDTADRPQLDRDLIMDNPPELSG